MERSESQELNRKLDAAVEAGNMTIGRLMDMARPYYSFNQEKLEEQALYRAVRGRLKRKKDAKGIPDNVILRGSGIVVNIPTCKSAEQADAAMRQARAQLNRMRMTYRKAKLKCREIQGQLSMFEEEED